MKIDQKSRKLSLRKEIECAILQKQNFLEKIEDLKLLKS